MTSNQAIRRTSCVKHIKWANNSLNQLFAYLKEREEVARVSLKSETDADSKRMWLSRLVEIESMLVWFVTNIEGGDVDARKVINGTL